MPGMSVLVDGCGWCGLPSGDGVHRGVTVFAHRFVVPSVVTVERRRGGEVVADVDSPMGSDDVRSFFSVVDRWVFDASCPVGDGHVGVPVSWVQLMNERVRLPFHAGWLGSCGCVLWVSEWELVLSVQVHASGVGRVVDFRECSSPVFCEEPVLVDVDVEGDCGWCGWGVGHVIHVPGERVGWFHEFVAPSAELVVLRRSCGVVDGLREAEYVEADSPLRRDASGFFSSFGPVLVGECPFFAEHCLDDDLRWVQLRNDRLEPPLFVGLWGSCGCFVPLEPETVVRIVELGGDGDA